MTEYLSFSRKFPTQNKMCYFFIFGQQLTTVSVKAKVLWSWPPFHLHHLGLLHRLHPRPGQGCPSHRPVDLRSAGPTGTGAATRWLRPLMEVQCGVDIRGHIVTYKTARLSTRQADEAMYKDHALQQVFYQDTATKLHKSISIRMLPVFLPFRPYFCFMYS